MGKASKLTGLDILEPRPLTAVDTIPVSYYRTFGLSPETQHRIPVLPHKAHEQWFGLDKDLEVFERTATRRSRIVHGAAWLLSGAVVIAGFLGWLLMVEQVIRFITAQVEIWDTWAWLIGLHITLLVIGIVASAAVGLLAGRGIISWHNIRTQHRRQCLHARLRAWWAQIDPDGNDAPEELLSLQEFSGGPFAYLHDLHQDARSTGRFADVWPRHSDSETDTQYRFW